MQVRLGNKTSDTKKLFFSMSQFIKGEANGMVLVRVQANKRKKVKEEEGAKLFFSFSQC